ncbi:MAG TPA: ferrochelatase [Alphaproteobacteria bacterium]|jgi:ferrochelatase|nr:ferrochelatase [Alphaproteobacteria bacterium]MDP7427697.1 ferrochelatase [Alphaproteobacteria bacterium]HJM50542.1 ferrochelatase [Alphaproteobacteria bacterium]
MRTAVVLFNLGGPDSPEAIRPFLFNLFNDPAIIGLPQPLRWLLARLISRRRARTAEAIYAHLGGRSPILEGSQAQALALQDVLNQAAAEGDEARVFVAMRYWRPRAGEVVAEVARWAPQRLVLLPLYPQYSTTTSASSLAEWRRLAARQGLDPPTWAVCCYPRQPGFIAALAGGLRRTLEEMRAQGQRPRLLLSAHGLPQRLIERGDPYQWQVEETAAALLAALGDEDAQAVICYQSRVGRLAWIGPSTEDEIRRAGAQKQALLVVPLSFVSEHSETLVELDIEYADLAVRAGVPAYRRLATVATDAAFIAGLAELVGETLEAPTGLCRGGGACAAGLAGCAERTAAGAGAGEA